MEDSELTYTLGFYPQEDSFDGTFHKLAVKVARSGVDVRSRPGYFATKAGEVTRPAGLTALIQDPLNATAIGITVQASPDTSQPGGYTIRASVDLHDIHLEHQNNTWVGTVDLSLFIQGSKTARTITRKIAVPDEQLPAALEKGIEVQNSIRLDAPVGELRVVAQDRATGAAGSITIALGNK